jgi:hypothetical protein
VPAVLARSRGRRMIGDRGEQWLTGVALAVTLIATLLFL